MAKSDLKMWKDRIRVGVKAQEKYGNSKDWDQWERRYSGDYANTGGLTMNYMFALAHSLIPQTYFRNPAVAVLPRSPDYENAAQVLEEVDNWLIQEMNLKNEFKRGILDIFLCGTAVWKIGYDSEFGWSSDDAIGPVATPMGVLDLSDESITDRDEEFRRTEYKAQVRPGMPWVLRVHPKEFIIDPAATRIEDAQWAAHRIMRRLSDVQADKKYEHTRDLKPSHMDEYRSLDEARGIRGEVLDSAIAEGEDFRPQPMKDDDWIELWEIRDARTKTIKVLSMDHKQWLRDEDDELQIDGLPYVSARFNEHPKSFWGIPDAQVVNPQQLELNEVRQRQQQLRRQAVSRILSKKGALSPESKERWLSEQAEVFVDYENDADDLTKDIQVIQPTIPVDHAIWADNIIRDMEMLVGFGRNQMGTFARGSQGGGSRRTATEASIVQQNAQIRVDERRDAMADVLSQVVRRVNQVIWKFWTTQRVARIRGPEGAFNWVSYTGRELAGEYDYKIEPDDALPMTRERRRQEALQLFQVLVQVPGINLPELVRGTVKQFEGWNAENLMLPMQAMMQGQQQGGQPGQEEEQGQSKGQGGGQSAVQLPMPGMQEG